MQLEFVATSVHTLRAQTSITQLRDLILVAIRDSDALPRPTAAIGRVPVARQEIAQVECCSRPSMGGSNMYSLLVASAGRGGRKKASERLLYCPTIEFSLGPIKKSA